MAAANITKNAPTEPQNRKQKAEQTRTNIINAALKLFAQHGFEGTSLQQISQATGSSVPLIVYYFKNKNNLWKNTIERAVEKFDNELNTLVKNKVSATDTLKQIIIAFVQVSTEFPEFHRLMLLESHEKSERLDWLYSRFIKQHNKMMVTIIKKAQKEGTVCLIAPERLLHAIVGMATISSQAAEFEKITKKDLFSAIEIEKTIDSIYKLIFIELRQ